MPAPDTPSKKFFDVGVRNPYLHLGLPNAVPIEQEALRRIHITVDMAILRSLDGGLFLSTETLMFLAIVKNEESEDSDAGTGQD